jgi:hypothetical protein
VVEEDPGRAAGGVGDADAVDGVGDARAARTAESDVVVDTGGQVDDVRSELAVGDVPEDLVR